MRIDRRQFHLGLLAATVVTGGAVPLGALARTATPTLLQGELFTIGNGAAGNVLLVYDADGGGAAPRASVPTGGLGSGSGLGSQGAVTLSSDGRWLLVVNAGSHDISCFALTGDTPVLCCVAPSGGLRPVSVAERHGLVYVVNDGSSQISGLRLRHGELTPIAGSTQPLSAPAVAPAQVSIAPDGNLLVVTEKASNRVTSFPLDDEGRAGPPTWQVSPGPTPFGFAFDRRGRFFVSEAAGGASGASTVSSYRIEGGAPVVVSPAVPNGQGAACWAVTSPDGRFVYIANTGSGNVSRYAVAPDGSLRLDAAVAGSTGAGSAPADLAMPPHGRALHVLTGGATRRIVRFEVEGDGTLVPAGALVTPAGTQGLAAN